MECISGRQTLEQHPLGGREIQRIGANFRRRELPADGCQSVSHEFTYTALIFRRGCHDEPFTVQKPQLECHVVTDRDEMGRPNLVYRGVAPFSELREQPFVKRRSNKP